MNRSIKIFTLLLPALFAGCAVISEDECHAGLWYERGIQDGARGRGQPLVYQIAQKCQEYGVRMDSEAWLRGHEEGVEQFCTPENGFMQGRNGRGYEGVCTGPTADLFIAEYQRGLAVYEMEKQYRELQSRREQVQAELYSVRQALAEEKDEDTIRRLKLSRRALRSELQWLDMELYRFGPLGFNVFH
jgi:hypothetical protein